MALPTEHGGWGLTLEPAILGLLLAPSPAALLLGLAAVLAFLVRTPLRLVVIGRRRGDQPRTATSQARTHLATRVAAVELVGIVVAVVAVATLAQDPSWWRPMAVALPLFVVALWFDFDSRSRHVAAEITGSLAIASVAAMGAVAGGATWSVAIAAWILLWARILTSIPYVRAQIVRIHGREPRSTPMLVGDTAALVTALAAFLVEPSLVLGSVDVLIVVGQQRLALSRPPHRAKVLGVRQMALGFFVVGATAVSSWLL